MTSWFCPFTHLVPPWPSPISHATLCSYPHYPSFEEWEVLQMEAARQLGILSASETCQQPLSRQLFTPQDQRVPPG